MVAWKPCNKKKTYESNSELRIKFVSTVSILYNTVKKMILLAKLFALRY